MVEFYYTDGNVATMVRQTINCLRDFGKHFTDASHTCSVCGKHVK